MAVAPVPPAPPEARDTVFAPAHRLVRELHPPLPPGEPEECAVADEFRPALGCLESLPLGESTSERPTDGRLPVGGSLPRRLWGQPILVEPRVRGDAIAGFVPTPPAVVDAGLFGFSFATDLPALGGEGDLLVQLFGFVVPPPTREFVTEEIEVRPGDYLAFGVAMHEIGVPFTTGPIEFGVTALTPSGERELFRTALDPQGWEPGWRDHRVELSELAGETVRLVLRTSVGSADGAEPVGFPLWGSPTVFRRTPRGDERNVILISLDTWRADHFDADVSGGPVTPRLAALAESGAVFEQAIATYPSTSASHMSLFTGLYPITHQVRFANDVLGASIPTLPEILAANGYQTGAVTENAMLLAETGFAFGFDSYFENKGLGIWSTEGQIDSTLERGRAWLEAHAGERFFLFLHTYQVHSPYEPAAEDLIEPSESDLAAARGREPAWVTRLRHRYAGEVRYADRALAAFLEELRDEGRLEDSVVVLTSDHGEEFAEHGLMGHSKSVYDEVLRVPLLVWAPGRVPAGTRVTSPVSLVDVVPTVLDLVGVAPPAVLHGTSLLPALRGEPAAGAGLRFAEGPDPKRAGKHLLAARTSDHKWIAPEGSSEPTEIYDLRRDPGETSPVDDEALEEEGRRHLEAYRALQGTAAQKRALDQRTTEKLRALGYVD